MVRGQTIGWLARLCSGCIQMKFQLECLHLKAQQKQTCHTETCSSNMAGKPDQRWLERALSDGYPLPNSVIRCLKKEEQSAAQTTRWEDLYFPEVEDETSNKSHTNTGSSRFGEEEEKDEEVLNKVDHKARVEKDKHTQNEEDARNTAGSSEKNPKDKARSVSFNTRKQTDRHRSRGRKDNQRKTGERKHLEAPDALAKSSLEAEESRNNTGRPSVENKLKDGAMTSPLPSLPTFQKQGDTSSTPKAAIIKLAAAAASEASEGRSTASPAAGRQHVQVKPPPSRPEDTKEHWSVRLSKPNTQDVKQLDHNYSVIAYYRKFKSMDNQTAPRPNTTNRTTNLNPRTRGLHFNFGFELPGPLSSGASQSRVQTNKVSQQNRGLYRPRPFMELLSTSPTLPCNLQPKRPTNACSTEDKQILASAVHLISDKSMPESRRNTHNLVPQKGSQSSLVRRNPAEHQGKPPGATRPAGSPSSQQQDQAAENQGTLVKCSHCQHEFFWP